MTETDVRGLAKVGGVCCIAGTLCYLCAAFVPLPDNLSYAVAMCWPVLSIVFAWAMRGVVASERESLSNSLAFVFACIAFATVASMISVQLAVRMGMEEYAAAAGADAGLHAAMLRAARLVDLGMDVAWDFFIGATLLFLGIALSGDSRFGRLWGIPTAASGPVLVVLNTITFPWPPDTRGLFDLGPFIGIFLIALGIRLTMLGFRRRSVA